MNFDNLFQKDIQLTENEYIIKNYILDHPSEFKNSTIDEISKKIFVSKSSIVRFAKKLGFSGFSELKFNIDISNKDDSFILKNHDEFLKSYVNSVKNLKDKDFSYISKNIYRSRYVFSYPTGNVQNLALHDLKRRMNGIFKPFFVLESRLNNNTLINNIGLKDYLIITSFDGENKKAIDLLKKAKLKGIKTLSITRGYDNTISRLSDNHIYFSSVDYDISKINYDYFSASLFFLITDFIFVNYIVYQNEQKSV